MRDKISYEDLQKSREIIDYRNNKKYSADQTFNLVCLAEEYGRIMTEKEWGTHETLIDWDFINLLLGRLGEDQVNSYEDIERKYLKIVEDLSL